MDQRNLLHPMTAGDLVQSAVIAAQQQRGDGVELRLLEVLEVHQEGDGPFLVVRVRDTTTGERSDLRLKPATPILVTGISL